MKTIWEIEDYLKKNYTLTEKDAFNIASFVCDLINEKVEQAEKRIIDIHSKATLKSIQQQKRTITVEIKEEK